MKSFKDIGLKFMWEVIYAYFYNWDGSHYLGIFLSILVVFGKSFVFAKMSKIFKNSVALFWRLSLELVQSHVPVASPNRDDGSMPQSRKILRIFFKIWMFLATQSGDLLAGGRSSREETQIFLRLNSRLSRSRTSSHEKHFDKFFKIFVLSVLATYSQLDSIAKIVCFAQIGQFLNVFSFPSNICDYSLSFLSEPLPKSQCSHTNPHILHILYPPSPIFK